MKLIKQMTIIFIICLISELIATFIPITIPASIIGMVLLLILLLTKALKLSSIDEFCNFLIKNMAFFFIPSGVGMIKNLDLIKDKAVILLLISFVTFLLTFIATYYTIVLVSTIQDKVSLKRRRK